jgi:hypothetical protein
MLYYIGLYDTQTFHIQDASQKYFDWGKITVFYLPWLQVGIVPNVVGASTSLTAESIPTIPVS